MAKSKPKPSKVLTLSSPWEKNSNSIWLASALTLNRNIEKFAFPLKLESKKRKQILEAVNKEVFKLKEFKSGISLVSEETTPNEKEFLHEHFLTPQTFHQAHSGEGFIVDKAGQFFVAVNFQDHLLLRMINCDTELEDDWNQLMKIEMSLGKAIKYAYSEKFGFMTADPFACGTGLSVSTYLQLPALIHTGEIEEFLHSHQDNSIKVTGLQGEIVQGTQENIGDVVVIENNYTLGVTEENILSSVRSFGTKLLVLEKSIRKKIKENEKDYTELKDTVSRAYGLLIHSYQIEAIEAMDEISLLKLALDLGWISGVTIEQLNDLFFNCRRAHLVRHFKEDISQADLPHKRAEYIHKTLKKAKLEI